MDEATKGPYIVWLHYGYEGWKPQSYPTLKEALLDPRHYSSFVVTKLVEFDVQEKGGAQ